MNCRYVTHVAALFAVVASVAAGAPDADTRLADFESRCQDPGPWSYRHLFWETGMIGQALYLGAEAVGMRSTGIGCFFDDVMHDFLGMRGREFQDLYHLALGMGVEDARLATLPAYDRKARA